MVIKLLNSGGLVVVISCCVVFWIFSVWLF